MTTTAQPTDQARATGGSTIRLFRRGSGLSQQQLADLAGISRAQLGRMERGDVDLYTAGAHCRFCGSDGGRGPTDDFNRVSAALARYARRGLDGETIA
jgi:DNA-binding XRE family transcriptional regulator